MYFEKFKSFVDTIVEQESFVVRVKVKNEEIISSPNPIASLNDVISSFETEDNFIYIWLALGRLYAIPRHDIVTITITFK